MPDFVPGLRLSRMFYEQAVRPILERHAPGLRHSAALIGPGSEVLGFDTPLSMDHSWGPRVQLFLNADDLNCWRIHLEQALSADLPRCFGGYSTHFATTDDGGALWMAEPEDETLRHGVQFHTVAAWFCDYLGWDPGADPDFTDWLTAPAPTAWTSTAPFSLSTAAMAPATDLGCDLAETLRTSMGKTSFIG